MHEQEQVILSTLQLNIFWGDVLGLCLTTKKLKGSHLDGA